MTSHVKGSVTSILVEGVTNKRCLGQAGGMRLACEADRR
jgi:hypothetical protein